MTLFLASIAPSLGAAPAVTPLPEVTARSAFDEDASHVVFVDEADRVQFGASTGPYVHLGKGDGSVAIHPAGTWVAWAEGEGIVVRGPKDRRIPVAVPFLCGFLFEADTLAVLPCPDEDATTPFRVHLSDGKVTPDKPITVPAGQDGWELAAVEGEVWALGGGYDRYRVFAFRKGQLIWEESSAPSRDWRQTTWREGPVQAWIDGETDQISRNLAAETYVPDNPGSVDDIRLAGAGAAFAVKVGSVLHHYAGGSVTKVELPEDARLKAAGASHWFVSNEAGGHLIGPMPTEPLPKPTPWMGGTLPDAEEREPTWSGQPQVVRAGSVVATGGFISSVSAVEGANWKQDLATDQSGDLVGDGTHFVFSDTHAKKLTWLDPKTGATVHTHDGWYADVASGKARVYGTGHDRDVVAITRSGSRRVGDCPKKAGFSELGSLVTSADGDEVACIAFGRTSWNGLEVPHPVLSIDVGGSTAIVRLPTGMLALWDRTSERVTHLLPGTEAAFSPDGKQLVHFNGTQAVVVDLASSTSVRAWPASGLEVSWVGDKVSIADGWASKTY